jgi:hypothetical protein
MAPAVHHRCPTRASRRSHSLGPSVGQNPDRRNLCGRERCTFEFRRSTEPSGSVKGCRSGNAPTLSPPEGRLRASELFRSCGSWRIFGGARVTSVESRLKTCLPDSVTAVHHEKITFCAACLTSALALGIATADDPGKQLHATGTVVSIDPAPPEEAKSVVVKTDAGEVKYVIGEAAIVTPGPSGIARVAEAEAAALRKR